MKKILLCILMAGLLSCVSTNRAPQSSNSEVRSILTLNCTDAILEINIDNIGVQYESNTSQNVGLDGLGTNGREKLLATLKKITPLNISSSAVIVSNAKLLADSKGTYKIRLLDPIDKINLSSLNYKADSGEGSYDRYWLNMKAKYSIKNLNFDNDCDLQSISKRTYQSAEVDDEAR